VPALPQTGLSQAAPCLRDWWGIWLGLALLTSLLLYDFATLLWMQGEKLDNGLILLIALGLMVQQRQQFRCLERPARPMLSSLLLLFGLLLFVVGRSQTILFFEAFSVWVILLACLHLVGGGGLLRSVWFPLLLLIFVMPLPGVFVNAFTGEMKQYVSLAVEMLLYGLGYPIARDGVILSVGPYQLLVADACSGINSIFSLTAIGLVYLYLTPKPGFGRNAILLVSILPIAILANVIRVLVLVLITYHFGYAAGQGFAHTTAHILLFIAAVALLIGIDSTLGLIASRRRSAG
jgi:exosortase B